MSRPRFEELCRVCDRRERGQSGFPGRKVGSSSGHGRLRLRRVLGYNVSTHAMLSEEGIRKLLTPSRPYNPINLLSRLHCSKIEHLHYRPRLCQLRCIIRRRCKLFQNLPSHSSCRLFMPHYRTISEIAFHKELYLLVPRKHAVATDSIEPTLYRGLDARLVFFRARACGCDGRRNGGDEGLRVGGDEMLAEFKKFRVCATDVTKLSGSEFWEIGLSYYPLTCRVEIYIYHE